MTQIAGGQPVNITADHQGLDRFPSWSPDGRTIAFVSQRDGAWGLYVTAAVGGSPRRLSALRSSTRGAPQWSPDGEEIAVHGYESGENFVETVSVESQETRRVRLPDHEGYESSNLRWSPDGRYFAYLDKLGGYEITRLWLVPASGGEPSPVTDGTTNDWSPSWSADGRTLFFVSNRGGSMDLWQQGIDEHGAVSGEAKPLTTGLGIDAAVFSPGGTTLAYSRGSRFSSTNVWRIPILEDRLATWTDAEQLTFDDGAYLQFVDVAQDGTRLVMSSDRRGNQDLWMVPSTGGSLTPLTTDRTPDWDPEWSPDGQAIAFYAYRSGNREVWVMPTEGGPARQLTHAGGGNPTWAPDAQSIAFVSHRAGVANIWIIPANGGEARQLTSGGRNSEPHWSPDGESVVFTHLGDEIWTVPASGGVEEFVLSNGRVPRWSPDGRALYFIRQDANLWALTVDDNREQQRTDLTGRVGRLVWFATDGTYLYFVWGQPRSDLWVMDVVQDEDEGSDN